MVNSCIPVTGNVETLVLLDLDGSSGFSTGVLATCLCEKVEYALILTAR